MSRQPETRPMTDQGFIDAYLRHLRNEGASESTIRTYRTPLTAASKQLPYGLRAEPEEIEEWLGGRKLARNTRVTYFGALRGFYAWMKITGRMAGDNPMDHLKGMRRHRGLPRPATEAELLILVRFGRERIPMWSLLAARGGLRCCEIATIDRTDITPELMYVEFGKGERKRSVPTHPDIWAAVHKLPAGLIGAGYSAAMISEKINREADRLGIPSVTAHRLRHLAGTTWQRALRDIRVTQELMGHASPATTAVYAAASADDMRAAVLAAPRLTASSVDGA